MCDFEIAVTDPSRSVTRLRIACRVVNDEGVEDEVEFTLESEDP